MTFFSRRSRIVDLTEDYNYERKHAKNALKEKNTESASVPIQETSAGGFFNFFNSTPSTPSSSSSSTSSSESSSSYLSSTESASEGLDADEKRRRLAKRLKDMTDRIEDLSNQIYLLQQKIELLEKKININKYE
jgi:hypothetical protein